MTTYGMTTHDNLTLVQIDYLRKECSTLKDTSKEKSETFFSVKVEGSGDGGIDESNKDYGSRQNLLL